MRCGGSTGGLRACNDQQSSGGGSVQEGGEGGGAESAESAESAEYSWHSKCSAVRLEAGAVPLCGRASEWTEAGEVGAAAHLTPQSTR
jgi:hypothetical protein